MALETAHLILFGVLFGAFFVEAMLGFGATVIAVTLGAQFMPLERILPVIAPLNLVLSTYLAVRHRRHIRWPMLHKRILPAVGLGVPVGLLLFNLRNAQWLLIAFGAIVMVISGLQLRLALRSSATEQAPLGKAFGLVMLGLGGVVHGLFNTGGPIIVYVLGRELDDKGQFRSTLAALFAVLTVALLVDYAAVGLLTLATAKVSLMATASVLAGLFFGEIAHARVDTKTFKRAVWGLLFVGGAILTARAIT